MPVAIRCRYCGARENISEVTLKSFGTGSSVVRTCSACRAGTPWDVVAGEGTSFAGARLFGAEEAEDALVEEGAEASPGPATAATKPRVLLVDDDEQTLLVLSKALIASGLDVETAESGRKALNRLVREDYDLVLCDVRMPEFDGKQLFAFLREHMNELEQRVIFLTGDIGTESTAEFFQQAGVPYLPKPVDMPLLLKMIEDRLGAGPADEEHAAGRAAETS